jgi:hypothetical protein
MKIYKAVERLDLQRPVQLVRPVTDYNGNIVNNLCISDNCELYDIDEYNSHDYFGDCPQANIKVREDSNGRLYSNINIDPECPKRTQHLARVMLKAFDEEDHSKEFYDTVQADHINPSIPVSNQLDNLEWVSPAENMYRAGQRGVMIKKYDKELVGEICQMICDRVPRKEIKETLGVNGQLIDDIRSGRSHKSVSELYLDKGFEYKVYSKEEKAMKDQ